MLAQLRALGGEERYTAFVTRRPVDAALAPTPGFRLVAVGLPTNRPAVRILWEQFLQPAAARRLGVDVLHSLAVAQPVAWQGPSVVSFMDVSFVRYPRAFNRGNRIYLTAMARAAVRRANRLLAISEHTRQDLVTLLGAPAERVAVTYCGVDPTFRPLAAADVAAFRARHDLPERFILYVGTLEPRKNVPALLDAYARLRGADRPPLVIVGGRGWGYASIDARIAALGLGGAVRFLGFVPAADLPLCYNAAALFVYPSLYEGFGLPPLEALACGIPVVASNTSSLPEVLGDAALLIDPRDPVALAGALETLLADEPLRARLRTAGLEQARRFSWHRMAEATRSAYHTVQREPWQPWATA